MADLIFVRLYCKETCSHEIMKTMGALTIMSIVVSYFSLAQGWYRPHLGVRFQWQLEVDDQIPFDYSMRADMYDVDLWAVSHSDIANIHA